MEERQGFSLCGKEVVTEANLRDEYYWKLVADFIGPQSAEGLELEQGPCRNRLLIQVGLMREDNNFPWVAIVDWLKKIFPGHRSADFRRLIERGIATTLSLVSYARLSFLESDVNFNFVGPICDSIGVERQHLLEMRDFSERAQSIEVTNGLILELYNFVAREKIAPVVLVTWLRNFNREFCKNGDIQKAFKVLRTKIKSLKMCYRNHETRSYRRNATMENLLQSPFELVREKPPKYIIKKRIKRDDGSHEKYRIKEEPESWEITEAPEMNKEVVRKKPKKEKVAADNRNHRHVDASNSGQPQTLLDIAMLSVQKLSRVYGGKTAACKQISLDLLRNQYALTCREHPALAEFEKKLNTLSDSISLASPVVFLNHNAHFLVDVHDAIEQHLMNFEKEIVLSAGEKLGRDKLPKFKNFVNLPESATSRYIHTAFDILSPRTPNKQSYRKHWVAFCAEKKNPSKLGANQSNQFNDYFEAAASLIHHHKEISLFLSDLLSLNNDECQNIILESVAADANDSVIQSLVCALAIVYCKVLGPYWQLLTSGREYSQFGQNILSLYQKFLDWSKDPSTLLEPEETTDVFLQFPLQEKAFDGVFTYCGHWHTNRDLIRACLKRLIKVIATVTEEHLSDFLPGGKFSQVPSADLSSQLVSCMFSVLMAEYPFSSSNPDSKKRPEKATKQSLSSDTSQEDQSGSSDDDFDESSVVPNKKSSGHKEEPSPPTRKVHSSRKLQEEHEDIMDPEYIAAMVRKNGGPCKTKQDVDKMMLRFDGKSRAERREAARCEMVYQRTVLNNTNPHLNGAFLNATQMVMKLKLALPRVKPGYSLVWAPRRTKLKPVIKDAAAGQNENRTLEAEQLHIQEQGNPNA
uniref:Zgc:109744 n=1 Tax=Amphiprion percula TaxID=161767 RepID=A0A3P8TQ69_AMPPE